MKSPVLSRLLAIAAVSLALASAPVFAQAEGPANPAGGPAVTADLVVSGATVTITVANCAPPTYTYAQIYPGFGESVQIPAAATITKSFVATQAGHYTASVECSDYAMPSSFTAAAATYFDKPFTVSPQMSASTSTIVADKDITIAGTLFAPGEKVTLSVVNVDTKASTQLGIIQADVNGKVSWTGRLPLNGTNFRVDALGEVTKVPGLLTYTVSNGQGFTGNPPAKDPDTGMRRDKGLASTGGEDGIIIFIAVGAIALGASALRRR